MTTNKKILVTGAAGFIGFYLVRQLMQRGGYEIVGLDNINNYYDVRIKYGRLQECGIREEDIVEGKLIPSVRWQDYSFVKLDITAQERLLELFVDKVFDGVIHLAAQAGVRHSIEYPHAYTHNNITGYLNILEGCRSVCVKHLVYASTSGVYGLNIQLPYSEHDPTDHPASLYAATKKANELMAHSYSHLFGIPSTGVRFFTVYGPWGRPDMALFLFAEAILKGKPIKVFNYGDMVRDFTYVEDIVEGLIRILERPPSSNDHWVGQKERAYSSAPFRIINIGNARPVRLLAYIEALETCLGQKAILEMMPMQAGDIPITYADVSELVNHYGYHPSVSIEEGVKQFVNWFRCYHLV